LADLGQQRRRQGLVEQATIGYRLHRMLPQLAAVI
jgi:hypothetical protein